MLLQDLECFFNGILLIIGMVTLCTLVAYYANSRRPEDDPKKKDYHPLAIVLAPITLPLFLIVSVSFVILRTLTYSIFVVLIILAIIFLRKPFILTWLRKAVTAIGDRLLQANTILARVLLRPWTQFRELS